MRAVAAGCSVALLPRSPSGITDDEATFNGAVGLSTDLDNFSPSIAGLTFGSNALNYEIKSTGNGLLQMNNSSSNATITVSSGSQTIAAPVQLISNTVIYPAPSATLNISGSVIGNPGTSLTLGDALYTGTLVEAITGSVSVAGATNISAGTLQVDGTWTTGVMNLTALGGGQGSGQLSGSGTINLTSGDGLLYNSTAASTFAGSIKGSSSNARLVVNGGRLTLSGTNTYTGGTVVNAGTLILTNSSAIAENTSLTIGAGGTLIFDPSLAAVPSVAQAAIIPVVASSAVTMVTSILNDRIPVLLRSVNTLPDGDSLTIGASGILVFDCSLNQAAALVALSEVLPTSVVVESTVSASEAPVAMEAMSVVVTEATVLPLVTIPASQLPAQQSEEDLPKAMQYSAATVAKANISVEMPTNPRCAGAMRLTTSSQLTAAQTQAHDIVLQNHGSRQFTGDLSWLAIAEYTNLRKRVRTHDVIGQTVDALLKLM